MNVIVCLHDYDIHATTILKTFPNIAVLSVYKFTVRFFKVFNFIIRIHKDEKKFKSL